MFEQFTEEMLRYHTIARVLTVSVLNWIITKLNVSLKLMCVTLRLKVSAIATLYQNVL